MRAVRNKHCSGPTWFNVQTSWFVVVAHLWLSQSLTRATDNASNLWRPKAKHHSDADLFDLSPEIQVHGPAKFPSPTRTLDDRYNQTVSILIQPRFGRHRPDADAILAYAEGYQLPYYMMFMETLSETGYTGDVVLAIAHDSYLQEHVKDYLLQFTTDAKTFLPRRSHPNLVLYQLDLDCDGTPDGKRAILGRTKTTDVFQMCRLHHVYGYIDATTGRRVPLPDPREGRVVATLRYEWYWIWTRQYQPSSWIMLLDARDSFFQSNPFDKLPRRDHAPNNNNNNNNGTRVDVTSKGLLYFFGENANATRLGQSRKNANWLRNGYGDRVLDALADKPTICSGSTMGEQIALETYLRALINEHDEGTIRMTGSDQGFHNYLFYTGKLLNADTIDQLVVWEQGFGAINNLGAMRTDSLTNWGIRDPDTNVIYQWDGQTPSPVVHQWDRDKDLHRYMLNRHKEWSEQWRQRQQAASLQ